MNARIMTTQIRYFMHIHSGVVVERYYCPSSDYVEIFDP